MNSATNDSDNKCINRRRFLRQTALGTLGLSIAPFRTGSASGRSNEHPNFILFLSDDHAKMDAGCYGNEAIQTPAIDRLASEGMMFSRVFSITATCSPSRASIYTGLGPMRHGAYRNHGNTRPGIPTLPEYLSRLGYRVLLAGKTDIRPKSNYPFQYIDTKGDWESVIVKQGSEVEQFLSSESAQKEPFCLVIATNNPHVPWPRDNNYDPAEVKLHPFSVDTHETRKAVANYYADTTHMDEELGRTLDLLDENNLAQNTAVVYTADQGPQLPHGKWELYDYGINVPYIVRWPGKVTAASSSDTMISSMDTLPTLIEAAGGTPPAGIDGRSFLEVLTGEANVHRDIVFATHTRDGMMNYFPIRAARNDRYKYIWNLAPERAFTTHITNSNYFEERGGENLWNSWLEKANHDAQAREKVRTYQHRPGEELYDLQNDPHELTNLAEEPSLKKEKQKLRRRLEQWMHQQGDMVL